MSKREKTLAILLAATFVVVVLIPGAWSLMSKPIQEEQDRLTSAQERLAKENDKFEIANAKTRQMALYKERSLSSNASQGAIAYQQWLNDLAEVVIKFNRLKIEPERISAARDNSSVIVRIKMTGEGTLEQVRDFLYRYYRANVLHHITAISLDAQDNSATPRLLFSITTEGKSLREAPSKGSTLFARTTLLEDLKDDSVELKVASSKGFPEKTPFEVRVGNQYVVVTAANKNVWKIERPAELKLKAASKAIIEHSPIHPEYAKKTPEDYAPLLKLNPFAKPIPYRPRLELTGEKSVIRGGSLSLELKASGFDTKNATTEYSAVGELPDGMKLADGKLTWKPGADAKAGSVKVKFQASAPGLKEPLQSEFEFTLKDVNAAPKITPPGELIATLGQPLLVRVAATDPETPPEQLKFKLADPAPPGAVINETTGEITFTPAASSQPGAVTLNVTVTDAGTPPQSATLPVSITVQDDTAVFTFLTGFVSADNERRAFLYDRSSNRTVILVEGKRLKYAGIEGLVKSITKDSVIVEQKNNLLRINLGENLRNAKSEPIVAAASPISSTPSEPPLPEDRVAPKAPEPKS